MGANQCCDTKANRQSNNPNQPVYSNQIRSNSNLYSSKPNPNLSTKGKSDIYIDSNPPKNYQSIPLPQQETPGQLIEETSNPSRGQRRVSLGASVRNSYSGGNMSPVSSVKNEALKTTKYNPFKISRSIQAHDKIIVCMIELLNKKIVTGSYDNTIKIWDLNNYNSQSEKVIQEEGKVFSLLEFEPNMLLSAIDKTPDDVQEITQINSEDILINLWDLNGLNDQCSYSFKGHQLRVNCLVKCDDKFFASCSNDGDIIIWDYHLKRQVNVLRGHGDCVLCMIQLNDGKLCTGSADMTIKIWDWERGLCENTLSGNTHWVKCLCQLNNGYIISGSHDNAVIIWDNNYQKVSDLKGHLRSVRSICQIGKTNYIATASFDHTIRIWNIINNECVQTLTEHVSSVINVIYHSEGYLISSSNDKTIKIWKNA